MKRSPEYSDDDLKDECNRLHSLLYHGRDKDGDLTLYGELLHELMQRGFTWDYSPTEAELKSRTGPYGCYGDWKGITGPGKQLREIIANSP